MQVDPLAPRAPDAAPAAHKRHILEERRFDRQDIKSGHVLGAVDTFEHENLKKGRIVLLLAYGRLVRQHYSELRAGGRVAHVEAAPGVVVVLAAWMLDPAACTGMKLGAPHLDVAALRIPRMLSTRSAGS